MGNGTAATPAPAPSGVWAQNLVRFWPIVLAFVAVAAAFLEMRVSVGTALGHVKDPDAHPAVTARLIRLEERLQGIQQSLARIERAMERGSTATATPPR